MRFPFKYSDKEWSAIAQTLPSVPYPDEGDYVEPGCHPQVREYIEMLGSEIVTGMYTSLFLYYPGEATMLVRLKASALALKDLLEQYNRLLNNSNPLDWTEPPFSTKNFCELLLQLLVNLGKRSELIKPGRLGSRRSLERDFYFGLLLRVWADRGGKFASSTDAKGQATGPLVRYMLCAVTPVYQQANRRPPTQEAIRTFIRRAKAKKVSMIPKTLERAW